MSDTNFAQQPCSDLQLHHACMSLISFMYVKLSTVIFVTFITCIVQDSCSVGKIALRLMLNNVVYLKIDMK